MSAHFAAANETYCPAPATPLARLRNPWSSHASKVRGSLASPGALWLVWSAGSGIPKGRASSPSARAQETKTFGLPQLPYSLL